MIMPNLDGKETFMRLREINPSIKILLTSSYSQNSKVAEILKKGAQGFIQKPYIMQKLSNIISETLNKSNS
ncbi:MAG TPA: response regulator [Candidatus Scalindua sp.]|nr:response regulator [Candidatus Scalindua sp.]